MADSEGASLVYASSETVETPYLQSSREHKSKNFHRSYEKRLAQRPPKARKKDSGNSIRFTDGCSMSEKDLRKMINQQPQSTLAKRLLERERCSTDVEDYLPDLWAMTDMHHSATDAERHITIRQFYTLNSQEAWNDATWHLYSDGHVSGFHFNVPDELKEKMAPIFDYIRLAAGAQW